MNLLPPDSYVTALADPIQELAVRTRASAQDIQGRIGKWEAEVEAFNLILLAATHAIAVAELARLSISFLPSSHALVRAGMEAGARSMWLLEPDDPFEREGRWLVHLQNEVGIRERLEGVFHQEQKDSTAVRSFSNLVRARLPAGTCIPSQVPKFDSLLKAIGAPEKYLAYAFFSQSVHGTHHGANTYRRNLGTKKMRGDFAAAEDWWLPMSTLWWFLATSISRFSKCCEFDALDMLPIPLQERFLDAQLELQSSVKE